MNKQIVAGVDFANGSSCAVVTLLERDENEKDGYRVVVMDEVLPASPGAKEVMFTVPTPDFEKGVPVYMGEKYVGLMTDEGFLSVKVINRMIHQKWVDHGGEG